MIGIVPARGGSKGIRHKNLMTIEGVPLVILAARRLAPYCETVYVSTEDPQIAAVARVHGFEVLDRPDKLADDDVTVDAVMAHHHQQLSGTGPIVMHQPTVYSPNPDYLDQFLSSLVSLPSGRIYATVPLGHILWKADGVPLTVDRHQRQDAGDYPAREIGLRYYGTAGFATQAVNRMIHPLAPIFDIDTPEDLDAARRSSLTGQVEMRYTAGEKVGHGHMRRVETIADELQHLQVQVYRPSVFALLSNQTQVVLNDTLDTTVAQMARLKTRGARVITLEDLGPGARLADLTINSLYRKADAPFEVIRPEFRGLPPFEVRDEVLRILVTFGGTDPSRYTEQIYQLARETDLDWHIVDPPGRPTSGLTPGFSVQVIRDASMVEEMRNADLVITSAGRTIFEAGTVGVPVLCVAQNLREARHAHLGPASGNIFMGIGLDTEVVVRNLGLLKSPHLRQEMSEAGRQLTDGRGAERIARLIEEML